MQRLLFGIAFTLLTSSSAFAADKLIILSPHRKSIQNEFIPRFEEFYKKTYNTDVKVEWLDNGGTADGVRLLRAKFASNPKTSGIDIFWGGGTAVYLELSQQKFFQPYNLPAALAKELPESVAGVPLRDKSKSWYASAMSSFGILYNKKALKFEGLTVPTTWQDLANPKYAGHISLADPRHSGTAMTMNMIVLQSMGWEKGFELLTKIAANNKNFTHSSSDPIKAIVSGDATASMAVDFYALPKVLELGSDNLGFTLPKDATVLDPDPIAMIKGAPNKVVAERFIQFVLSADAQKLLILPKGSNGGPRLETLGRMAVNKKAYDETENLRQGDTNPFKQAAFMKMDLDKSVKIQRPLTDLIGAVLIDTHKELKAAWKSVVKRGSKPDEVAQLVKLPITEQELLNLNAKWDDNVFRNQTINSWVEFAKNKYNTLAK